MTGVLVVCRSWMRRVMSGRVRILRVYTTKFHLLDNLMENIRRFRNISVIDACFYQQSNVHIKMAYQRSSKMRTTRIHNTVLWVKQQKEVSDLQYIPRIWIVREM